MPEQSATEKLQAVEPPKPIREAGRPVGGFAAFLSHYKVEAATEARWLQGELEAEQLRADEAEQRCAQLRRQLESSRASAVEEEEEELPPPPPPAAKEAPARLERQRQRSAELEAENQRLVQVCLIDG